MYHTFIVRFKDEQEIHIADINKFGDAQLNEISQIAGQWTQRQLQNQKQGCNIESISNFHKEIILHEKDKIVQPITSEELYDNNIIKISLHSIERTFQRVGTIGRGTYIELIDKLKQTNKVIKTQWKGYQHLTYTLEKRKDPEKYKIVISFLFRRKSINHINIITIIREVISSGSEPMENRLMEDPLLAKAFTEMEKRLKNT